MDQEDPKKSTLQGAQDNTKDIIRRLGRARHLNADYDQLDAAVQACIAALLDTVTDVPVRTASKTSKYRPLVKVPSQKLSDIKTELEELLKWFSTGRRPSKRKEISEYALAAMLGESPFGNQVIAARQPAEAPSCTESDDGSDRPTRSTSNVFYYEMLSGDPAIAEAQVDRFLNLRGPDDQPLAVTCHKFHNPWPTPFTEIVRRARKRSASISIDSVQEMLNTHQPNGKAEDKTAREGMKKGVLTVLGMFEHLFGDLEKSRITLARWSRPDPIFALVRTAIDVVWPITQGLPSTRRIPLTEGQTSERELLQDLAQQLVTWVQAIVDAAEPGSASKDRIGARLYARYGGNQSVIGTRDNQATRAGEIVFLVLSLRAERLAYSFARSTMVTICQAVLSNTKDEALFAAAQCVSTHVITQIDKRKVARDRLLDFGYDHLEGDTLKWFGRFQVSARFNWGGESQLAQLVLGGRYTKQRLLKHFDELVQDLFSHGRIDKTSVDAWARLSNWAGSRGRTRWEPARILS